MANSERRELVKLLKKNGWSLYKQNGGHCQFVHPDRADKITVPFKIKKNIELSVKRQMRDGARPRHLGSESNVNSTQP